MAFSCRLLLPTCLASVMFLGTTQECLLSNIREEGTSKADFLDAYALPQFLTPAGFAA